MKITNADLERVETAASIAAEHLPTPEALAQSQSNDVMELSQSLADYAAFYGRDEAILLLASWNRSLDMLKPQFDNLHEAFRMAYEVKLDLRDV